MGGKVRCEISDLCCASAHHMKQALDDRLQLLKPRLLIAEATYSYNGKKHDITSKIDVSIKKLQQTGKTEAIIIGPSQNLGSTWSVTFRIGRWNAPESDLA